MAILLLTDAPDALESALVRAGVRGRCELVGEPSAGLVRLQETTWELVLLDADFADGTAVSMIEPLSRAGQRVVVMAARPTLDLTLRSLQAGALDVIPLPPAAEQLQQLVSDAKGTVPAGTREVGGDPGWIGSSPVLLETFRSAVCLAGTSSPLLVWGETGTGKELLSRIVHERSARAASPFLAVNCAAIQESQLDSELFGHERGAFPGAYGKRTGRFAKAHGGTLLLDEISELSPRLQAKVAQVLSDGLIEPQGAASEIAVDVRLAATTVQDPSELVRDGRLLPELYYRLVEGTLRVPPLRERGAADIRMLADHFVRLAAARHKRPARAISEEAYAVLERHSWPGNVRQLRGALERAVLESRGERIEASHLPADLRRTADLMPSELSMTLTDLEKRHILRTLEMTGGHFGHTSEILGIHRNTLRRKLDSYGMDAGNGID